MATTVSVTNTDAGLSGKTIINADDPQTITALKTFNRTTNAPFAVVSGAAVVPNLDADKLDGQEGSYYLDAGNLTGNVAAARISSALASTFVSSSYTPTITNWTAGNAVITGKYLQIGKAVWFDVVITWGNTSAFSGALSISVPVTASAAGHCAGSAILIDTGTGVYAGGAVYLQSTSAFGIYYGSNVAGLIDSTHPHTWAATDVTMLSGFYFAA